MPYKIDNPPDIIKNIPKGAQKIWIETFNAVEAETKDENKSRQAAWSNVKTKYRKVDDKWVSKAALVDINLIITKASIHNGKMRWQATASDTLPDIRGESTSMSLFGDWIERVEKSVTAPFLPPPRNPFLGLSHYPDLDGYGEAGFTVKMYIDGNRFKVSGEFYPDDDHPLGKALFEAVREEQALLKKGATIEEPIRISAAWWDIGHKHGNFIFERKSLDDVCPMCIKQAGGKVYLKGQLDHFAATRVPINQRTSLSLEEKSMATTREQDAASIIGEEKAKELEEKSQKLVGKSEAGEIPALVIKAGSDFGKYVLDRLGELEIDAAGIDESIPLEGILSGEIIPEGKAMAALAKLLEVKAAHLKTMLPVEKAAMKTVGDKKYPAGDFLVVEDVEKPTTWHLQVKRNGKPDHGLMGGAWAALNEGFRGKKYDGPDKAKAVSKLKAMYKSEKMDIPTTKKAEVKKMDETMEYALPLGGATSIADAESFINTAERMDEALSRFDIFQMVFYNILESHMTMEEKLMALKNAVKELDRGIQAIKSAVEDVYLSEVKEVNVTQKTPSQDKSDTLLQAHSAVEEALKVEEIGGQEKVAAVQKALTAYAQAAEQKLSGAGEQPAPDPPDQQIGAVVAKAFAEGMAPFMEQITLMNARMAAQAEQPAVLTAALPQQKSLAAQPPVVDPQQAQANQLPISPISGEPSQLRAIINRSVGLAS